jgi:PLP dependent protein
MNESHLTVIQSNLSRIKDQISSTALRCGRDPAEVHLVVVTKSQPVEIIQAAILAGAHILGENYPEETEQMLKMLPDASGIEWHMIGHLQSRKIPIVVEHFHMLHSLDSLSLAEKLNTRCAEFGKILPVLLEVNTSGEESKYGLPGWKKEQWADLVQLIGKIQLLPNLEVRGLMTMPPLMADAELVRPFFRQTRELRDYIKSQFGKEKFNDLSMGTSADYLVGIEEGATYIRVGQAVLGPRPPKI